MESVECVVVCTGPSNWGGYISHRQMFPATDYCRIGIDGLRDQYRAPVDATDGTVASVIAWARAHYTVGER
jgi:hypothetical protein